jgi:hypothetical protein
MTTSQKLFAQIKLVNRIHKLLYLFVEERTIIIGIDDEDNRKTFEW